MNTLPVISKNAGMAPPEINNPLYEKILKDNTINTEEWKRTLIANGAKKIEPYQSIIPSNILSRPPEVMDYLVILGIDRVDLPRLPNGKHLRWWYLVQLKTCRSCIFLSKKDDSLLKVSCLNPKMSKEDFFYHSASLGICSEWFVGYDDDRIADQKKSGYMESSYLWAAFESLGMCNKPESFSLPAIGNVEIFKYTAELARFADIHNQKIYYHLQLYYNRQAGHNIDDYENKEEPLLDLPIVKGQNFDTNIVQSQVER